MKYIKKNAPPAELVAYRKTPNATYKKLKRRTEIRRLIVRRRSVKEIILSGIL